MWRPEHQHLMWHEQTRLHAVLSASGREDCFTLASPVPPPAGGASLRLAHRWAKRLHSQMRHQGLHGPARALFYLSGRSQIFRQYALAVADEALKTHAWVELPAVFCKDNRAALFVLALINDNCRAAASFRPHPNGHLSAHDLLRCVAEYAQTTSEVTANILRQLLVTLPVPTHSSCALSHAVAKNNAALALVIAERAEIDSHDWETALRLVCDHWSGPQLHTGLNTLKQCLVAQQAWNGNTASHVVRAVCKGASKTIHPTLSWGWAHWIETTHRIAPQVGRHFSRHGILLGNCARLSIEHLGGHPAPICQTLVALAQPHIDLTEVAVCHIRNGEFEGAENLLTLCAVAPRAVGNIDVPPQFERVRAWVSKGNILNAIPHTPHPQRRAKL